MACCEYRSKDEEIFPKSISYFLLFFISIFLFVGLIFFGIISIFSAKVEKIAKTCFWGIYSLSNVPNLKLSEWKLSLSAGTFNFSPSIAGFIYKNFCLSILLLFDLFFWLVFVKFALFLC